MTAYVDLPGSGTTRISTPDSAALSLLGDFDVRALVSMVDWTPSTIQGILSHWSTTSNQRSWSFQVNTNGTLSLSWSVLGDATTITSNSTVAPAVANGAPLWVRCVHDVDNGAAGNDVLFYTSTDPISTAPGSVTWVQLGTTVTTAGTTSHFNSTTTPLIGAITVGNSIRLIGKVYVSEWRSVIAGTIVASPDFRTEAQITTPNTVFTDPQGNVWTLQTAAAWTIEAITGTGASTLGGVTSDGSGTFAVPAITGTGASTLAGVTSAGTGVFTGDAPPPSPGGGCCGGRRRCCRRDRVSA